MKFSVLICTYNRADLLRQSLQALIIDTLEKPDQVVVVNGGTSAADEVVRTFMSAGITEREPGVTLGLNDAVEVRLVKTVNKNLAASRNVGLGHCTGDIIAMTDDDALVFPDWVRKMKQAHSLHEKAGGVGGTVYGTNIDSLVGKVADLITFPTWKEPRVVRTLPGVNISYKRAAIEPIGLQDETLFRGEDVDFNWRVMKQGYEIYFVPEIKVHHHHRPTLRGFLNQHYMYGRAYYLVRKKWPEMYCIYPHRLGGLRDLLKAGNAVAGILYQPFLDVRKLNSPADKIRAFPLLFMAGFIWRWGMLVQRIKANADT